MTDAIIDELVCANPVPLESLGELKADHVQQLLGGITAPPRPRRLAPRRIAVAVVVVLAIVAPLAVAANRTQLLGFGFGDPAPSHIKQQLDHMLPPAYGPKEGPPDSWNRMNIVRGSERLVAQTTLANGKLAHMYAIRLKNGGVCWASFGKPFGGGGCGRETAALRAHMPVMGTWGSCCGSATGDRFAVGAYYVGRALPARATSLVVRYRDGLAETVPLDHGWFMYAVPEAHEVKGHEPVRFELLDASGAVVATLEDPFGLHRRPQRPVEKPVRPRLLARLPLNWRGGQLELAVAKGDQGHPCVRVLNTIDPIQTSSWNCGAYIGRSTPVLADGKSVTSKDPVEFERGEHTGGDLATGYVYFHGWAGPPVASVELRFQDSTVETLDLHEGFFVWVVPPAHWTLGTRPSYLIGRDRSGAVVYRRFLYPQARCTYPGRDARCKGLFFANG